MRSLLRYAVAVVASVFALAGASNLGRLMPPEAAPILFLFPVLVGCLAGGPRPGLVAAGLTALAWPFAVPGPNPPGGLLGVALALPAALVVCALAARPARLRAEPEAAEVLGPLWQHAPAALAFLDADLHFRRVNDRFAALTGLPAEAHLGRTPAEVLPESDAAVPAFFRRVREAGHPLEGHTLLWPAAGGEPAECRASGYPVRDAGGRLVGVLVLIAPASKTRKVLSAVRASEERFRTLADAAPVLIWQSDAAGVRAWFNRRWLEFTGRTMMEELGGGWAERVPAEDRACCREAFAAAFERRVPFRVEYALRRADGEYRRVLDQGVPWFGPDGAFAGYVGAATDVTDERRALEAAAASEARERERAAELEAIMAAVPAVVWISHDPESKRMTGNPASYELLRLPPGTNVSPTAVAGERPESFRLRRDGAELPPEELPLQRAARGEEVRGAELELAFDDGSVRHLIGNAAPLRDERGRPRGAVAAFLDITERKRSEEALEEADRRKDEFLAVLAHELRNPLAPLRNSLAILRLRDGDPQAVAQLREVMERQVRHLARLVDDLLDVSRITRGKVQLQPQPVELAAVVYAALETSRPLTESRRQALEVELPRESVWLEADPTRLAQVLSNLLNNAAKYTPEGGRIEMSAKREGAEAVLTVCDTGIGIPPEMLPRVFDLFTQAEQSLDRAQGGLGIGLTLVKKLAEMHGGRVEARSEGLGKGSTFTVRLPVRPEGPPSWDGGAGSEALAGGLRVLVVEDNCDTAASLEALVGLWGSETRVAYDGPSALREAESFRPDVVLLDIGLPGMDGYEVARHLRRLPAGRRLRLIALTGWGREDDQRRAREAGFDRHLTKPVDDALLRRVLAELRTALRANDSGEAPNDEWRMTE